MSTQKRNCAQGTSILSYTYISVAFYLFWNPIAFKKTKRNHSCNSLCAPPRETRTSIPKSSLHRRSMRAKNQIPPLGKLIFFFTVCLIVCLHTSVMCVCACECWALQRSPVIVGDPGDIGGHEAPDVGAGN